MRRIAGIDEAGRGPLAGPVVAAAVILDPARTIDGLDDSKKLTSNKRSRLYDEIIEKAQSYGIGIINREEIDRINILQATHAAMQTAVDSLTIPADHLLIDGKHIKLNHKSQETIVGGDALESAISAASILAKVTRDRMMVQYNLVYPGYGFDKHKGYGTAAHIGVLKELGATPIHRQTFKPVMHYLPRWNDLREHRLVGHLAEQLAATELIRSGYEILEMNYTVPFVGEIDIVAHIDGQLIFCEVKAKTGDGWGSPEDQITMVKRDRIMAAASGYCQEKEIDSDIRFDVISVRFTKAGPKFSHIQAGIHAE